MGLRYKAKMSCRCDDCQVFVHCQQICQGASGISSLYICLCTKYTCTHAVVISHSVLSVI